MTRAAIGILAVVFMAAGALPVRGVAAPGTDQPTDTSDETIGFSLETLSPFVAHSLGLEPDTKGAVVTEVLEGTPAALAGLQTGDVITEIDQKPVSSAEQVTRLLGDRKTHLLRVMNGRGSRLLTLAGPTAAEGP